MKITVKQLKDKKACLEQVAIFQKEWPKGAEITLEALQRAVELGLDIEWFALTFLPAPAREAYEKAIASALEAYKKAIAPAWEAYEKARAPALYQAITEEESTC